MFLQAKLHEVRVDADGLYKVANQNNIDFLFSVLLMFTNMYTVPMVAVLFSCNWYLNKYYFGNFDTICCWLLISIKSFINYII